MTPDQGRQYKKHGWILWSKSNSNPNFIQIQSNSVSTSNAITGTAQPTLKFYYIHWIYVWRLSPPDLQYPTATKFAINFKMFLTYVSTPTGTYFPDLKFGKTLNGTQRVAGHSKDQFIASNHAKLVWLSDIITCKTTTTTLRAPVEFNGSV